MQLRGPSFYFGVLATTTLAGNISISQASDNPVALSPSPINVRETVSVSGSIGILPTETPQPGLAIDPAFSFFDTEGGSGWNSIMLTADNRIFLHSTGDHGGQNGRPRAITIAADGKSATMEILCPYARQITRAGYANFPTGIALTSVTKGNPTTLYFAGGHGIQAWHQSILWPDNTVGGCQFAISGALGMTALNSGYHAPTIVDSTHVTIPLDSTSLPDYNGGATATLVKPGYGTYVHDNTGYAMLPSENLFIRGFSQMAGVFDLNTNTWTHGNPAVDFREWPSGPYYAYGSADSRWLDGSQGCVGYSDSGTPLPGHMGRNSASGYCETLDIIYSIGGSSQSPPRPFSIIERILPEPVTGPKWRMRTFQPPPMMDTQPYSETRRNCHAIVGKYLYIAPGSAADGNVTPLYYPKFFKIDLEAVQASSTLLTDAVIERLADCPDKMLMYYVDSSGAVTDWQAAGASVRYQCPPGTTGGSLTYDPDNNVLLFIGKYGAFVYELDNDKWVDVTPTGWSCASIDCAGVYHAPTKAHYVIGPVSNYVLSKFTLNYRTAGTWTSTTGYAADYAGQSYQYLPWLGGNKHTRWVYKDGYIYQCGGDFSSLPLSLNPAGYPAGEYNNENCRQDMWRMDPYTRPLVWEKVQDYYHLNQAGRATDQPGPYHPDELGWIVDKDGKFWAIQGVLRRDGELLPTENVAGYSTGMNPGASANGVFGSFIWHNPGWEMRTKYNENDRWFAPFAGNDAPYAGYIDGVYFANSYNDFVKNAQYDPVTHRSYAFFDPGTLGRLGVRIFDHAAALGPDSHPWITWQNIDYSIPPYFRTISPGVESGIVRGPSSGAKCAFVGGKLWAVSHEADGTRTNQMVWSSWSYRCDRLVSWHPSTHEIGFSSPLPNGESFDKWFGTENNGFFDRCQLLHRTGTNDIIVLRYYGGEQSTWENMDVKSLAPIYPGEVFIFIYHTDTDTWSVEDPAPAKMGPNAACYLPDTDEVIFFGFTGLTDADQEYADVANRRIWIYKLRG